MDHFEKHVGSEIAQGTDDPRTLLIGIGKPKTVKVPAETGHGGEYACLKLVMAPCPACFVRGVTHDCVHYILDGPVHAAECKEINQFVWYSRKGS